MKNKKAQIGVAGLVLMFVGIIVALSLIPQIFQNQGTMINQETLANHSLTTVVNGTAQYITTHRAISNVLIINETANYVINSGNYTIENNVLYNGALAIKITPNTAAATKSAWKVSGTVEPLTYVEDSGTRQVASLVGLFATLALLGFVLYFIGDKFDWF